jgi:hypothetical protein
MPPDGARRLLSQKGQERRMSDRKLGRADRGRDPRIPHLSALLAGLDLPPPPASQDWTQGLPSDLGVMLNDKLNCCSCAAFYHAMQVWSFHATGALQTQPDANVEALYCAVSGFKPSEAPPGPICNEQQVLTHIHTIGAPTGADGKGVNRIAAFVEVDPRNADDVKRTIAECGVAYIGFGVPRYLLSFPPVWDLESGVDDTVVGGHAAILAGYDANGAKAISGGKIYTMTWPFFAKYVDEAYALADPAWIGAKGTSPGGLSLAALEKQMRAISS